MRCLPSAKTTCLFAAFASSLLLLIVGGYFIVYQLFFLDLPLENLAYAQKGGKNETFRYDMVADFEGFRVEPGEKVKLSFACNQALRLATSRQLEFFIRLPEQIASGNSPGRLLVSQSAGDAKETHRIELTGSKLQRHTIPLLAKFGTNNGLHIHYRPRKQAANAELLLATNVRNVRLWPVALASFAAAIILFFVGVRMRGGCDYGLIGIIATIVVVAAPFHGGMFVSNDFAPHHNKIVGLSACTAHLVSTGHFPEKMYRNAGGVVVPLATAALEGGPAALHKNFARYYPSSRYVMFVWFFLALAFLVAAIRSAHSWQLALCSGLLLALFWPFIENLYFSESDALFIPLMIMFCTVLIRLLAAESSRWRFACGKLCAIVVLMLAIKITPIVLVVFAPLALWVRDWGRERRWWNPQAAALFAALLVSAFVGKSLQRAGMPANAHVGIPGVVWQKSVFWHMLWAANGHWDEFGPWDLHKSGRLRNKRVAAATGLPESKTYIRQSQLATEKLYRPDVLAILHERPGLFLTNAGLRLKYSGTSFLKRPIAKGPWTDSLKSHKEILPVMREGTAWKIMPIWLLASFMYHDVSPLSDVLFLAAAGLGLLLLRSSKLRAFGVFGIACFAARMGMIVGVHALVRYVNFLHVPMLIGLAAMLVTVWNLLKSSAETAAASPESLPQSEVVHPARAA